MLIAHEPLDALTLADRVALLETGRITQTGTPDEIRAAPSSHYAADLVGCEPVRRASWNPSGTARRRCAPATARSRCRRRWPVAAGTRAIASLKPIDVSLHAREPEGSARNVFRGRIAEIADDGERARLRIDTRPPLTAEVTSGSVARLGLRTGDEVWASFKAVEVSLQIEDGDDAPAAGTLAR